nr:hypothetical protein [Candidatus Methylacidiphilum infernorum]
MVIDYSQMLEFRIKQAFTRPAYKPITLCSSMRSLSIS